MNETKDVIREIKRLKEAVKIDPIIDYLLSSENPEIRLKAVEVLGEIGDKRAVQPLIKALKDEDPDVRYKVAIALGKIEDKRAVEPLIELLKNQDKKVRYKTIEALGKIGDKRAIKPVIQALKDEGVCSMVIKTLNPFRNKE